MALSSPLQKVQGRVLIQALKNTKWLTQPNSLDQPPDLKRRCDCACTQSTRHRPLWGEKRAF
jgi:hypothetical protein